MYIILRNLRCRILYFWAFFAPRRTSFRSVIKSQVELKWGVNMPQKYWTYLHTAKKLFFLFLPLLFELNQVSCMRNQKTILLIHFYPKWTFIVCRKYSSIFMDVFLFDIELTFLHFTGYCLRAVNVYLNAQCFYREGHA